MIRRSLGLLLLLFALATVSSAQEVLVLKGRVVDSRGGVPYATLQLVSGMTGVCCNDQGYYELKIPTGQADDSVLVRSIGHIPDRLSVKELLQRNRINLKTKAVMLREVNVSSYRDARHLMMDVILSLNHNFQQQTAYSTFFYRDWRAVDEEIYLFDEAVMEVERAPYSEYTQKRSYRFSPAFREMETNYKTILRHRLLVNDRQLLLDKVGHKSGVDEMLEYADDKLFYDPVAAPNASFSLSESCLKKQSFMPLMEFDDGEERYYLVRSTGASRLSRNTRFEYVIRKRGLALVRITSWIDKPVRQKAPEEAWVKPHFNNRIYETDSTTWIYDERDGKLTLSRYYSASSYRLVSSGRGHDDETQLWQQSVDWTLTNFSSSPTVDKGEAVDSHPQTLDNAFGHSDFSPAFWGHYNTIPIDSLAMHLLEKKLIKNQIP